MMTELVLILHSIALCFIFPDYVIAAKVNSRSRIAWALLGLLIYFLFIALALFPMFQFGRSTGGIIKYIIPVSTCAIGTIGALLVCRFVLPTPGRLLPAKRTAALAAGLALVAVVQNQKPSFLSGYVFEHGGPWKSGLAGQFQRMGALADVKGLLIIVTASVFFILLLILIRNWQIGNRPGES